MAVHAVTLLEDPAAAHQIVLRTGPDPRQFYGGSAIIVSCTCTATRTGGRPAYEPIEARNIFPAAEARAAWRAWHEKEGIAL